jgi:hypothetical protein
MATYMGIIDEDTQQYTTEDPGITPMRKVLALHAKGDRYLC